MTKNMIALAVLGVAACSSSSDEAGPDAATPVTDNASARIAWIADHGAGDYTFLDGTAEVSPFTPHVTLPLANDATVSQAYGIGIPIELAAGFSAPDGLVTDDEALDEAIQRMAADYALVYRTSVTSPDLPSWLVAFPEGLSCGVCVHADQGFDSYAPVACDKVMLVDRAGAHGCNDH